jgi:hypothetical protein
MFAVDVTNLRPAQTTKDRFRAYWTTEAEIAGCHELVRLKPRRHSVQGETVACILGSELLMIRCHEQEARSTSACCS